MNDRPPYQIPLPLQVYARQDLSSFYPGDNQPLVNTVLKALSTPQSHEFFYVFGPAGCGKSHFLSALNSELQGDLSACFLMDLSLARNLGPESLNTVLPRVVLLDNIDSVAGDERWEMLLFSVFNRWYDARAGVLVVTASCSYDQIPFGRSDLNTRLGSGIASEFKYLNPRQCAEALQLKARLRGLRLSNKTATFLVQHYNHDLGRLTKLLDRLEHFSLQEQHELTIPFIKQMLGN